VAVISLHRYPVKSLLGEDVAAFDLDDRGVVGDRSWSIRTANGKIGSGKNTRRFADVPGLLQLRASTQPVGHGGSDGVTVTFPDGRSFPVGSPALAEQLSIHCGQPVTVARETDVSHFDDGPVSIIGRASVDAVSIASGQRVDPSRFRANVMVETDLPFAEEKWIGAQLRLGTALLEVTMASPRCVMVDMATADLPAQAGNLRTIGRLNDACLGVIARVVRPGRVSVSDGLEY
jgi:uncharacterized protein